MKPRIFYTLIILFFSIGIFNSCNKENNVVSGTVLFKDKPVENAMVIKDGNTNQPVYTNSDGEFSMQNVEKGEHDFTFFKIYSTSNSSEEIESESQKTVQVNVKRNTTINSVTLPNPVFLKIVGSTFNQLELSWTMSSDANFREYKVYRHSSSGIDELTGELIHVSTNSVDTIFINTDLSPSVEYYYRVYILDDNGKLGGSNIATSATDPVNYLQNGDIENVTNSLPEYWTLVSNDFGNPLNKAFADNSEAYSGSYSVQFHHADSSGCWEQWMQQEVDLDYFVEEGKYELEFMYKSNFNSNEQMSLILRNHTINLWLYKDIVFKDDGQWHNYIFPFTIPEDKGYQDLPINIHFCTEGIATWWIDDIKIKKVN